ncbi:porin family protein [Paenimyroides aestuarii]|uniref:PorT family protein n=1 Tax=Paenimyroides aestuarii TaxID=2968490 RepID=A0ABY5NTE8_9FLAO|nr:porin family protein [Paenimyroides aestuarii]UUV21847.1 PorT family protein [Paenimyroides aestuarii]
MRKITMTLLGLVAFSTSALAQQEVKFGPKAGVNFANLSGLDNSEMKIGFHVGAVAEIKFNEKFSIQPEVIYSTQGAKTSTTTPLGSFESEIKNDYINVPIMAKYYIVDGFSAELGPYVGFLMKSESEIGNLTGDSKDAYKSVDFGLGVGLAYDMPMGFFVGARYNLGLSKANEDISAANGNVTFQTSDLKNGVIQVGVGYKF